MHDPRVNAHDEQLKAIDRNLRAAYYLALFVEFCFLTAVAATAGAFNGGLPTTTPPSAQIYLVVSFVVTIALIFRIRQMRAAAQRSDMAWLQRSNMRAWALIALVFSAVLPSIYLNTAVALLPRH